MQRIEREIGTIVPVNNTTQYIDFPKIEFLSEVWLDFQVTNTIGTATAVLKPESVHGYGRLDLGLHADDLQGPDGHVPDGAGRGARHLLASRCYDPDAGRLRDRRADGHAPPGQPLPPRLARHAEHLDPAKRPRHAGA